MLKTMVIERTASEFIIRFPITDQPEQMQDLFDYLRYRELTASYRTDQSTVDEIAREINKKWWDDNKDRFIDME
jgi:hypothetical protein